MNEEIEARRYYLEMEDAAITSICLLLNDVTGFSEEPDFTIVIGLKEEAGEAARKAAAIGTLMEPARPVMHGAAIGNGHAVITLSYRCTSPHNNLCPVSARKAPPAFILGLLAAEKYIAMDHYHRLMAHLNSMEDLQWGTAGGKMPLESVQAFN